MVFMSHKCKLSDEYTRLDMRLVARWVMQRMCFVSHKLFCGQVSNAGVGGGGYAHSNSFSIWRALHEKYRADDRNWVRRLILLLVGSRVLPVKSGRTATAATVIEAIERSEHERRHL